MATNFPRWLDFIVSAALPTNSMQASHASAQRSHRQGATSSALALPLPGAVLQEWPTSTLATLALLARWATTLHGSGRSAAMRLLDSFLAEGLKHVEPPCLCWCGVVGPADASSPPAVAGDDSKPVRVIEGQVQMEDLGLALSARAFKTMRRTCGAMLKSFDWYSSSPWYSR